MKLDAEQQPRLMVARHAQAGSPGSSGFRHDIHGTIGSFADALSSQMDTALDSDKQSKDESSKDGLAQQEPALARDAMQETPSPVGTKTATEARESAQDGVGERAVSPLPANTAQTNPVQANPASLGAKSLGWVSGTAVSDPSNEPSSNANGAEQMFTTPLLDPTDASETSEDSGDENAKLTMAVGANLSDRLASEQDTQGNVAWLERRQALMRVQSMEAELLSNPSGLMPSSGITTTLDLIQRPVRSEPSRFQGELQGLLSTDVNTQSSDLRMTPQAVLAPSEVVVAEQIRHWVVRDVQNAQMRLDGLGDSPVHVDIRVQGQLATVLFASDNPQARALIQDSLKHLQVLLGQEGLVLSGASVSTSAQQQRSFGGQGQADTPSFVGAASSPAGRRVLADDVSVPQPAIKRSASGLDLYV